MSSANICFITAIYGNYEASCKKFVTQTVETDFICFTDDPNIISNGWIVDTTPYHLTNKSPLDDDSYNNSLCNNSHTFNVAKYYKQAFRNIPRLEKYDVVVWLDGTVEIYYAKTSEYLLNNIYKHKIIGWSNEYRNGEMAREVAGSMFFRYTTTFWNGQHQPIQDVQKQYMYYLEDGYTDEFFKKMNSSNPDFGIWITCFVAFLKNDPEVKNFLDLWYLQTLKYTTQDQISFSYVCQKTNLIPNTLPNHEVHSLRTTERTMFYIKRNHGI
uniref:Nucleotide-diphospho-sugar transferase domain-containing protein n=1 Tax=viral metagenome TaxID=1070528 RepID=A0A6C0JQB5_9ZZZZ